MSLGEFCIVEDGLIRLEYRYPVCPVCNAQRPFDERSFIQKMNCCRPCDIEMRPAIYRKGEEER